VPESHISSLRVIQGLTCETSKGFTSNQARQRMEIRASARRIANGSIDKASGLGFPMGALTSASGIVDTLKTLGHAYP
jgi:hypothetical protein